MVRIILSLSLALVSATLNAASISLVPQPNPDMIKVTVYDTSGMFSTVRVTGPDEVGPWVTFDEFNYSFWTDASGVFIADESGWGTDYPVEWHPYAVEEGPLVGKRADLTIVTGDWSEGTEGGSISYVSLYSNGHSGMSFGASMRSWNDGSVPEPATLTMTGLALVCLGSVSRRRLPC